MKDMQTSCLSEISEGPRVIYIVTFCRESESASFCAFYLYFSVLSFDYDLHLDMFFVLFNFPNKLMEKKNNSWILVAFIKFYI